MKQLWNAEERRTVKAGNITIESFLIFIVLLYILNGKWGAHYL